MLGVAPDKLKAFPQLNQSAVRPAIEEINALSDFNIVVESIRKGGPQRGALSGFRVSWASKEPEEWNQVMAELSRSKIGRKARIRGAVEALTH